MEAKSTVLIVDDDPASRDLLQRVVSHFGFDTLEAEDGEDALAKYREHKPDLIISDIYMPKMNGVQLLHNIKKQDERVRVILITGYYRYRTLMETSHCTPDGYLEKPYSVEELGRLVRQLLHDVKARQAPPAADCPTQEITSPVLIQENAACDPVPEHDG